MNSQTAHGVIRVMCADDNPLVGDALRAKFSRIPGFQWVGFAQTTIGLVDLVQQVGVDILLLDLDLPGGGDPFLALAQLSEKSPEVKTVVFSGHVRKELIDRVIEAGAWGYASKNDGEDALIDVVRLVIAGEFAMSADVRAIWYT